MFKIKAYGKSEFAWMMFPDMRAHPLSYLT